MFLFHMPVLIVVVSFSLSVGFLHFSLVALPDNEFFCRILVINFWIMEGY